jgi:uncharacterized membrane protein YesL
MFKKHILNYKTLTNSEKLKTVKVIFYTVFIAFFIYFTADVYYFKVLKKYDLPYSIIFMFPVIFYINFEKKMKAKIADEQKTATLVNNKL